ncbi:hypothetical protein Q8F55_003629 [Vanrija albida]|uniref:FAD/NAD(P)-binding domain-containing protein n=1 Tax=Vanrija albida TaxID=181172 RepID=A0ABR3Q4N5_9TREE
MSLAARAFPILSRAASTSAASTGKHKVVVVGAGTGGLTAANQIYNALKAQGKQLADGDIAIIDAAKTHDYQPGFTIVGGGLADKTKFRRDLDSLIPKQFEHIPQNVKTFEPGTNQVVLADGSKVGYEYLVVAPGIELKWSKVKGLPEAIANPAQSKVGSIYSYDTVDKAWDLIRDFQPGNGEAVFTQPFGPVKCAGAPQKVAYLSNSYWKGQGRSDIHSTFVTGIGAMFGVPHYAKALNELRLAKGNIDAKFNSNLVEVKDKVAVFEKVAGDDVGSKYEIPFGLLHVVPPQGAYDFVKNSAIADAAGFVEVDDFTTQHKKYENVFSLGDASSLPTSKTAAAITAQAPVLTHNLISHLETGKIGSARYDGYTSCPLFTGDNKLLLAEFKYGGELQETFARWGLNQAKPNAFTYYLTKDFFPAAYFAKFVKGEWYGPRTLFPPTFL